MADSFEGKILAALLDELETLVFDPVLPIGYPSIDFSPSSDGSAFIRTDFFLNGQILRTIGSDPEPIQGFLQASVYWPSGQGIVDPLDAAALIKGHFKNKSLWSSGHKIKINQEPEIAAPIIESDWVQVPVTIYWQAFAME